MPNSEKPIDCLGKFIHRVSSFRKMWGLPKHRELWFRGEGRDYVDTKLRPELYRPAEPTVPLKPIWKLLSIENDLHDEFQRNAVELSDEKMSDDDWAWDSYFLMQHHEGPTRLLDWSDGALMALHFALRKKQNDSKDACVYVLEPYRLLDQLNQLPDAKIAKEAWKNYVAKHPSYDLDEESWEESYIPSGDDVREELNVPRPPLVLDFPNITRRIAAQRGRFIVFGTEPNWLYEEFQKPDSTIKVITIAAEARSKIRQELRDCGVTESVIYPDLDGLGREMKQLWEDRRVASEENA